MNLTLEELREELRVVRKIERARTTIEVVIDAYVAIRRTTSTFDISAREQLSILCDLATSKGTEQRA